MVLTFFYGLSCFRVHLEGQVDDLLVFAVVALKRIRIHGDELGVRFFKKFTFGPELGEGFLHGLASGHAGSVGVQLGLLLHLCGIGVCPLPMHV